MSTGVSDDAMLAELPADGFRDPLDVRNGEVTPRPGIALGAGMRNCLPATGVAEQFLGPGIA